MSFVSLQFILFVTAALTVFHLFRRSPARPLILLLINGLFLWSFMPSVEAFLPFLLFLLGGYVFIAMIAKNRCGRLFAVFILLLGFSFAYLKHYTLLEGLPYPAGAFFTVGLSYILFRIIQLMVDVYGQAIRERIPFLEYLNFLLFFPNFVSGPIQRYQDFKDQTDRVADVQLTDDAIQGAFSRILTGYVKIVVIAWVFQHIHVTYGYDFAARSFQGKEWLTAAWYATAVVVFTLYLYYNFSGYMDIVIGIGKLIGFDLPENFHKPFHSGNFLDFWSRWHITLSQWFRIYLFNPLLKVMMKQWGTPVTAPYLGVITFFITFFIMGFWHGTTLMFLIYGFFLGLGVSMNKLYQIVMARWPGKSAYHALGRNRFYQYLSRGMTISYFCLSLTCLWMNLQQVQAMFGLRFLVVGFAVFWGLSMVMALFFFAVARISTALRGTSTRVRYAVESSFYQNGWMAGKLILLYYVLLKTSSSVPDFIYKAF